MKNNKNKISVLLSRGFEPKNNAKARIKMALQQKVNAPKFNWRPALVVGSILLLVGLGIFARCNKASYLGPNAGYAVFNYDNLTGQSFGESGPRGLEATQNYIHFQ